MTIDDENSLAHRLTTLNEEPLISPDQLMPTGFDLMEKLGTHETDDRFTTETDPVRIFTASGVGLDVVLRKIHHPAPAIRMVIQRRTGSSQRRVIAEESDDLVVEVRLADGTAHLQIPMTPHESWSHVRHYHNPTELSHADVLALGEIFRELQVE